MRVPTVSILSLACSLSSSTDAFQPTIQITRLCSSSWIGFQCTSDIVSSSKKVFSPSETHSQPKERKSPLLLFSSKTETDADIDTKTKHAIEESGSVVERSVDSMNNTTPSCWNPTVRKMLTGLSLIGMAETGYLSYLKLFDPAGISKICGGDVGDDLAASISSCSSVLNSPYATIHVNDETNIPLTIVGFLAYTTVATLSAYPLIDAQNNKQIISSQQQGEEELNVNNRIAILCTTTSMATFSSFLLSLLFNTLHQSCAYCILSAGLSLSMGFTAWITGMLPAPSTSTRNTNYSKNGFKLALGSFVTTTIASLLLFFSVDEAAITAYQNDILASSGLPNNVVATAAQQQQPQQNIPPPPITSKSSEQSLKIGQDLKELNTRFFGAYWCSHCYEQKQRLGKEAMANVVYIECSKDGLNSQNKLCNDRGVPGYPTWEIGGNLYPGEMYLDELEEIIAKEKKNAGI